MDGGVIAEESKLPWEEGEDTPPSEKYSLKSPSKSQKFDDLFDE